uniref:Uncharacterized protein n=1 Tax=Kalanchoe fedtschenkoi TaxID=63787 RepID=A0A7N0VCU4_KALFE
MRSKMDSLIFTTDSVKATKAEENVTLSKELLTSQPGYFENETNKDSSENGPEEEVEVENVERPVDLYKVSLIFAKKKPYKQGFEASGRLYCAVCFIIDEDNLYQSFVNILRQVKIYTNFHKYITALD